jgi:glycerate-2-kinase
MGALGTSVSTAILVKEVRGETLETLASTSPNPVTRRERTEFVDKIMTHLPAEVPDWLRNQSCVAAASGPNSMFQLCLDVLIISGHLS